MNNTFTLTPFSDELWRSLDIHRYLKKSKDPTRPEAYYEQLSTGQAGLLIGNEQPEDFCIFRVEPNNVIWISAIYSPKTFNAFAYYQDDFFELAKNYNCTQLKWCSYRNGYHKGLKTIPIYKIESITYSMSIPNDDNNDNDDGVTQRHGCRISRTSTQDI